MNRAKSTLFAIGGGKFAEATDVLEASLKLVLKKNDPQITFMQEFYDFRSPAARSFQKPKPLALQPKNPNLIMHLGLPLKRKGEKRHARFFQGAQK